MTNAELFQYIFGVYATELWAFDEETLLEWLNEDAPKFKLQIRQMTNAEILEQLYGVEQ